MQKLDRNQINAFLASYALPAAERVEFIDSSHGEEDARHNYILDRSYVLRVNSAPVFTERRLSDLNRLIERYRAFGLKAPLFLPDRNGRYLQKIGRCGAYVSEYLDLPLADGSGNKPALARERLTLVARFAWSYRGVDLVDTPSMYSLFDLSPYDALTGIDEKQDNLNELAAALRKWDCGDLAARLEQRNRELRGRLLPLYQKLPHCVFQGDENFSNLCLDETGHIAGIFDFNMAGTDVIANYLANLAFQARVNFLDEGLLEYSADEVYSMILDSFRDSTGLIQRHYTFSALEKQAYLWYAEIVLLSGYVFVSAAIHYLEQEQTRPKVLALLQRMIEGLPPGDL